MNPQTLRSNSFRDRGRRRLSAGSSTSRAGRIRTDDLTHPKRTRYQAAPQPAAGSSSQCVPSALPATCTGSPGSAPRAASSPGRSGGTTRRDGRTRTADLRSPEPAPYQAGPRPDEYPRRESNPDPRLRRPVPCPLDHAGMVGDRGVEPRPTDLSDRPRHRLSRRPWRRDRDSNPGRTVPVCLSRAAPSTTRPPLHGASYGIRTRASPP